MFQGFDMCQTSVQIDRSSKELQTSTNTEQDKEGWADAKTVRERKRESKKDDRKQIQEGVGMK